jgi:predicted phosphohydrolase
MKIIITCDLHLGHTSEFAIAEMVQNIINDNPDVVVIGGDVGERPRNFSRCLSLFDKLKCSKLVLVGNHDLWAYDYPNENSLELWTTVLPQIAEAYGFQWLEDNNFYSSGIAIGGSYLHYDYSAKETVGVCSALPDEFYETNKHKINNDGNFMRGLPTDKEFAASIGAAFRERLQEAQDHESVSRIIVVTHVPCLECQMVRKPNDYKWAVANAYFGNLSHQDVILGSSKVTDVISGHSHVDVHKTTDGVDGRQVNAVVIGSDYGKPKTLTILI